MKSVNINEISEFASVTVFGKDCLYTIERISRDSLPKGLYAYDVRETNRGSEIPSSIETYAATNLMGTLISKQPLINGGTPNRFFSLSEMTAADEWVGSDKFVTLNMYLSSIKDEVPWLSVELYDNDLEDTLSSIGVPVNAENIAILKKACLKLFAEKINVKKMLNDTSCTIFKDAIHTTV